MLPERYRRQLFDFDVYIVLNDESALNATQTSVSILGRDESCRNIENCSKEAVAEAIVEEAARLKCGDPADPDTDVGTVITADAAALFERRVNKTPAAR